MENIKENDVDNVMNSAGITLVIFLNDNHLSNVKTIQNICRQDYSTLSLYFCNDCTNHFQAERFIYNIAPNRRENVKSIYMKENRHPKGEVATMADAIDSIHTQYVMIMHSGEYFTNEAALKNALAQVQGRGDMLMAPLELWDNNMKHLVETEYYHIENCNSKDCMIIYQTSFLKKFFSKEIDLQSGGTVCNYILQQLDKNMVRRIESDCPLCKYSEDSIRGILEEVPPMETIEQINGTAGIHRKQRIKKSLVNCILQVYQSGEKKYYNYSRVKSILKYSILELLLLVTIGILLISSRPIVPIVLLLVLSVLLAGWIGGMVCYNLMLRLR